MAKKKNLRKLWIIIPAVLIGMILLLGIIMYFGVKLYSKATMLPADIAKQSPEDMANYCNQKSGFDKDQCYFQVALRAFNNSAYSDGRYCLMIDETLQRNTCIMAYATWWNNTQLCNQLQLQDMKTTCIASINRDVSMCNQITVEANKNICINQVTKMFPTIEQEKAICLQSININDKDNCLYYLAYKYKDYKTCSSITNESLRMNCISSNLYYHYQNNNCADLQTKDKDMCFTYSASIEKDKTICNNIQDNTWKTICMND